MEAAPVACQPLELPHVWRGRELAAAQEQTVATGHAALDAVLPGQGWPVGALVEILQERAEQHVWQLLLPGLVASCTQQPGPVMLVAPPFLPFLPALQGQGFAAGRLLCVDADPPAARLWAVEQGLRCGDVAAVLAWLPQVRNEDLRRLHLGAQQTGRLLFVFRGLQARDQSSPARLRLLLTGSEQMEVRILKRRGPPLLQPLVLPAQPARLRALLAARRLRRAQPFVPTTPGASHVLDRTAALAG